jgi:putative two-component system response regulator
MENIGTLIVTDKPMSPSGGGPDSTADDHPGRTGHRSPSVPAAKIMIVDDEPLTIRVVRKYLSDEGYGHFIEATDAVQAVALAARESPDIILLDVVMPRLSGMEVLDALRRDLGSGMPAVIIHTASTDRETKLRALRGGATDFLHKPVDRSEIIARVENVLLAKAHQDQLRGYARSLEDAVRARTAEIESSRRDVIRCLARAAEFRDDDTGRHILRVGRYARIIGSGLGMDESMMDVLEQAAQLHDVGKIGIPDAILLKPGRLTSEEFGQIQKHCNYGKRIIERLPESDPGWLGEHPRIGAEILGSGRSDLLKVAMQVALTHHERWDGSGYPLGLSGEDIPLVGRIVAVADVFDALSSRRPYKAALPLDECFAILADGRGTHFDPRVLDQFLARRDEVVGAQIACADID